MNTKPVFQAGLHALRSIQIDEIGLIYEAPVLDAQGNVLEQPAALADWHVNASKVVNEWADYLVTPNAPRRVFSGSVTVFYTFPSHEMFKTHLATADLNPPEPRQVPASVAMRQARLALLAAGKLSAVQAVIDTLPEPARSAAQIEWDYSNEVQRHNGFVAQIGPALALTPADIDALFITAEAL